MTGNDWMQDNHDNWNNSMDLAGITNKGVVGFKYFGFGGLEKDTKGVKAFQGTAKGDGTTLYLNLTPGGHGAFKVHVMLDGPWANDTWKGREIAVLDIAADAPRQATMYKVAVPEVEGLKGKHAIYLVAEGPEVEQPSNERRPFGRSMGPTRPEGLFDLHGIGFSKGGAALVAPVVPTVTITIDGKEVKLPNTPVRSTNANGYCDVTHYQAYAPLTNNGGWTNDSKMHLQRTRQGVSHQLTDSYHPHK